MSKFAQKKFFWDWLQYINILEKLKIKKKYINEIELFFWANDNTKIKNAKM